MYLAFFFLQINLLLHVFLYNLINQLCKLSVIINPLILRPTIRRYIVVYVRDLLNDTMSSHLYKTFSNLIDCMFRFRLKIRAQSRKSTKINTLASVLTRLNRSRCDVIFPGLYSPPYYSQDVYLFRKVLAFIKCLGYKQHKLLLYIRLPVGYNTLIEGLIFGGHIRRKPYDLRRISQCL